MADVRGNAVACDDRCGCPSPCPGDTTCARRAGMIRPAWSTSSARAGSTVGATHAPVPRLKSRGQARLTASAMLLLVPVQHALLKTTLPV
ncbi:hypothetical protein CASFOL_038414 [Castilleja foliolosa]|uniref:Uncharacterized protein n=1 Tax=Castilleja foliolosa TaxID=1961234 RepID=A0ABD3BLL4_9LAMI